MKSSYVPSNNHKTKRERGVIGNLTLKAWHDEIPPPISFPVIKHTGSGIGEGVSLSNDLSRAYECAFVRRGLGVHVAQWLGGTLFFSFDCDALVVQLAILAAAVVGEALVPNLPSDLREVGVR